HIACYSNASCSHRVHRAFPTRRSSDLVHHRGQGLHSRTAARKTRLRQGAPVGSGQGPLRWAEASPAAPAAAHGRTQCHHPRRTEDRKSTRLNSSHVSISYAVFCLKKKT